MRNQFASLSQGPRLMVGGTAREICLAPCKSSTPDARRQTQLDDLLTGELCRVVSLRQKEVSLTRGVR